MTNFRIQYFIFAITMFSYPAIGSETKGGLPQLDLTTYPSLIFWSIISLLIGYFLMRYLVTPNIKSILNSRETSIQNDLVKAKSSSQEADKIKQTIIKNQEEIKLKSQSVINDALLEAREMIEKDEKDISNKLDQKVSNTENKIINTQKQVIDEVISSAEEITANIVRKFTNLKCNKADIEKAVKLASKRILMEK
ncbi:preprotein translocase subunit TatA [Alphaproteobacteria bacterium]|jgi:F-type H+-transporting ATPase subunit b|nr:preprotein translocase subunit TatA [Alphaproteobacteria bacterium]